MKLMQQALERRANHRETDRLAVRNALHAALADLLPAGTRVWLYGSVIKPGRFAEWSDLDLALECEPKLNIYLLMSLLAERTGRPVDLSLLEETGLRETIQDKGELWTL